MGDKTGVDFYLNAASWLRMDEKRWQAVVQRVAQKLDVTPERAEEMLDAVHKALAAEKQAN